MFSVLKLRYVAVAASVAAPGWSLRNEAVPSMV